MHLHMESAYVNEKSQQNLGTIVRTHLHSVGYQVHQANNFYMYTYIFG